jgi:hypothetical protein
LGDLGGFNGSDSSLLGGLRFHGGYATNESRNREYGCKNSCLRSDKNRHR